MALTILPNLHHVPGLYLRKITGMPSSRLDKYDWSPQNTLWQRWRKERKFRNKLRLKEGS